jgi:undecaprenyl-diphosphatase
MVIPPILGEALLDVLKAVKGEDSFGGSVDTFPLVIGFLAAFLSGCFACKLMINLVKKGKLVYFGIYCAIVGVVVLTYQLTR